MFLKVSEEGFLSRTLSLRVIFLLIFYFHTRVFLSKSKFQIGNTCNVFFLPRVTNTDSLFTTRTYHHTFAAMPQEPITMDFLEYPEILKEEKGGMISGRLKLTNQCAAFKNNKTGKVDNIWASDIENIKWMRFAASHGLHIMLKNGTLFRFGGFNENDHDKLTKFFSTSFKQELKNKELSLKGWNWGTAKFQGSVLSFDVDNTTAFEAPLIYVSHCTKAKNEVTLEFHQNYDAPVSLVELRFHIPADPMSSIDTVQAFVDNVLEKASIIQATGDAIVTFKELHCLTPRGRYDFKIFPTFIQLHGKTFDYKIPLDSILRLFLLPHKDGRQMFFVLSIHPPINQGHTRYQFLILSFNKEEETAVELNLSEEDIKQKYEDKLQKEMSGPTFEVISRVMKAIVQRKVTVPGSFKGYSGTQTIACSYRAGNGLLYPLERGLIYIHKPPVHIRFDEIASVNFARSGGSTRSFDFEVETKSGVMHTFSSIEKEEYGRLFDFVNSKKLRIKNINTGLTSKDKSSYDEDEPDAYLQRVKAEGGGSTDEESSDESFVPEESGSEVSEEEEYGRLFDLVNSKKLRTKNLNSGLTSKDKSSYSEDQLVDSDIEDEPDGYQQRVKAEGCEREGGGSTDDESSDESFAPCKKKMRRDFNK